MRDDPSFDLSGVMWPRSSDGISYTVHLDMARIAPSQGVVLSTKNAHPGLSATVLDYLYGEEGNMLANFGKLGESYEIVNGEVKFTDLILNNPAAALFGGRVGRVTPWGGTSASGPGRQRSLGSDHE